MNDVLLIRAPGSDQGTFGVLLFGGQRCYTIELPWRHNIRRVSCIPPGDYECALVRSPRFGIVYAVHDVPSRSAILIHPANLAGDTSVGWATHLQGCIAPFERPGRMRIASGRWQRAGMVSRSAVDRLMHWAAGRPFRLSVIDDYHV